MATIDTVVPNSLNYTDIKPQAIENKIQLCRYQPTVTINGVRGGEMLKFLISGNGFLDPYSTYFQFKVKATNLLDGEVRFLDRSAHSFISRMVIRSQGVEIERIEDYDVIAAMINDMIYSPEQNIQHYWEGFPGQSVDAMLALELQQSHYTENGVLAGEAIVNQSVRRSILLSWLTQGGSLNVQGYVGECAFHEMQSFRVKTSGDLSEAAIKDGDKLYYDTPVFPDHTRYLELAGIAVQPYPAGGALPGSISMNIQDIGKVQCPYYPLYYAYTENGQRVPPSYNLDLTKDVQTITSTTEMQFIIPIYSGVIGLLMPEKKLLPLNLLPLDIEIVFNKHALYSSHSTGSRDYQIQEFFMYGNTLFFEQEIHRTLEASVADHGLFIYCNSFHSAPRQIIQSKSLPSTVQISMNLKSINSVHWVFMYNYFDRKPCARKLHFVSHNVNKMQLLNGTTLIPQYPIEGNMGTSKGGQQVQFILEMYKAWNRMHDPALDNAIHSYNTCGDQYAGQFDPIYAHVELKEEGGMSFLGRSKPTEGFSMHNPAATVQTIAQLYNKQSNVGRCQYGISLEGEELGSDRTMITGRKSQYPFQIQMVSSEKFSDFTSHMFTFLRADFIIYIRPDLQIVTLGK